MSETSNVHVPKREQPDGVVATITLSRGDGSTTRWFIRKNYPSEDAFEAAIKATVAEMEGER